MINKRANKRKQKLIERNQLIREEFKEMTNVKHLDSDYACSQLAVKHTLDSHTIWKIIKRHGRYNH